jgi:hypothetical protein
MKPIYFLKSGVYKISENKPYLNITADDTSTKKKFYIDDRYADMMVARGSASYYMIENVVKEVSAKPVWRQYLERQGANSVAEKEYLSNLCVKLGGNPADIDDYKRKDFRSFLESAFKEKPDVLDGVINGVVDLSTPKEDAEILEDIFNGEDDDDSFEAILNGK